MQKQHKSPSMADDVLEVHMRITCAQLKAKDKTSQSKRKSAGEFPKVLSNSEWSNKVLFLCVALTSAVAVIPNHITKRLL